MNLPWSNYPMDTLIPEERSKLMAKFDSNVANDKRHTHKTEPIPISLMLYLRRAD